MKLFKRLRSLNLFFLYPDTEVYLFTSCQRFTFQFRDKLNALIRDLRYRELIAKT